MDATNLFSIGRLFEAVNGTLFLLDLFILGVFLFYIGRRIQSARGVGQITGFWTLVSYSTKELGGALALIIFFLGATIARAVVWLWRIFLNEGMTPAGWMADYQVAVLMVGVVICCVGAFCILRVFSEQRYRAAILSCASVLIVLVCAFALLH